MWTLSGKCKIDIQREETIKIVKHKKTYIPFFFFGQNIRSAESCELPQKWIYMFILSFNNELCLGIYIYIYRERERERERERV